MEQDTEVTTFRFSLPYGLNWLRWWFSYFSKMWAAFWMCSLCLNIMLMHISNSLFIYFVCWKKYLKQFYHRGCFNILLMERRSVSFKLCFYIICLYLDDSDSRIVHGTCFFFPFCNLCILVIILLPLHPILYYELLWTGSGDWRGGLFPLSAAFEPTSKISCRMSHHEYY